jgi:hypothetical protein
MTRLAWVKEGRLRPIALARIYQGEPKTSR